MWLYRSLKMVTGFVVALMAAEVLHLNFPVAAGIITMLNLQSTKKASLRVAWKRIYMSLIGLLVAWFFFGNFGFNDWALVLLVAVMVPLSFKLGATEAIAVIVVLATHLMALESVSIEVLFNEFSLLLLGAIVAFVLNLHMPNHEEKLEANIQKLEHDMRLFLLRMALGLKNQCTYIDDFLTCDDMIQQIKASKAKSYEYMNNFIWVNNGYYLEYFSMRLQQVYRLKVMQERLNTTYVSTAYASQVSAFTNRLAMMFEESNDGLALKAEIEDLLQDFKDQDLPKTREAFEERAALYQYLQDMKEFIDIKIRFYQKQLIKIKS